MINFVLSVELGSGCLNTTRSHEKHGQEPHREIPTLSAALPVVHRLVVPVIFQIETVNRRPLTFEAVAHEDLG
jgi:hypothetical protein